MKVREHDRIDDILEIVTEILRVVKEKRLDSEKNLDRLMAKFESNSNKYDEYINSLIEKYSPSKSSGNTST